MTPEYHCRALRPQPPIHQRSLPYESFGNPIRTQAAVKLGDYPERGVCCHKERQSYREPKEAYFDPDYNRIDPGSLASLGWKSSLTLRQHPRVSKGHETGLPAAL